MTHVFISTADPHVHRMRNLQKQWQLPEAPKPHPGKLSTTVTQHHPAAQSQSVKTVTLDVDECSMKHWCTLMRIKAVLTLVEYHSVSKPASSYFLELWWLQMGTM